MKHSLTTPPGGPTSMFDLLAESLGGGPASGGPGERSSALKPTVLERLERALWRSRQREMERQLEGAVDAVDLEAKMRQLERRMFHRYY